MSKPLFSIVIPVYNTEKELPRCLDSILAQTLADYEVVLVNDGSLDGSGALCDDYADKDNRIHCIHKVNEGAAEARNTGIRNAVGRYLMFLDSDDYWGSPEALREIADVLVLNEFPDLVCFGTEIRDENGKIAKVRIPPAVEQSDKETVLRQLVFSNQYFSASYVKVVSNGLVQKHGLSFIKGLVSGEDAEWSGRVMVNCRSIAVYHSAFYQRIRRNSGSVTSQIKLSNVRDFLVAIEEGLQYVKDRETNTALRELYHEYWAYQYAMLFVLLGNLEQDPGYSEVISRMETYKWLLKYDHVKKVRLVKLLCKAVGIRPAVKLLKLYNNS